MPRTRALQSLRLYGLVLLTLLSATSTGWGKVVHVNKNSPGPLHDGAAWGTAFLTVQAGIDAAVGGDEVWVAASNPAATAYVENITLKGGVPLYGGFTGTETVREQRDWTSNVTVIDGNGNDVVTSLSTGTVLDGFTIRNDSNGVYFRFGVNVSAGTSTITNCNVVGNSYGIYVDGASAAIKDCAFSKNSYGVYQYTGTSAITNCVLSGNYAGNCTEGGSTTFTDCVFSGNTGEGFATRFGAATVVNCTMSGNTSGVYNYGAPISVINCTITGNSYGINADGGTTGVTNCIVAYNQTGLRRAASTVPLTPSHSDVYGNTTADFSGIGDSTGTNGNISLDPLFTNRGSGDLHLLAGSPCINAGDIAAVTPGEKDLDGKPRIIGAHVDMGAFEFGSNYYTIADAAKALRFAAGLEAAPADIARWNVAPPPRVDILDAVHIARMAAGFDANP